jgi:hypothetical protein
MTTPDGESGLAVVVGVGDGAGVLGLALADADCDGADGPGDVGDGLEEQPARAIIAATEAPTTTVPVLRARGFTADHDPSDDERWGACAAGACA